MPDPPFGCAGWWVRASGRGVPRPYMDARGVRGCSVAGAPRPDKAGWFRAVGVGHARPAVRASRLVGAWGRARRASPLLGKSVGEIYTEASRLTPILGDGIEG